MPQKKYTQPGVFSVIVLVPVLLFSIVMLFLTGFDEPVTLIIVSFIILTFIVCLLIFYKLTIIIDDTHLTFSMGIGLIRKSFLLSDIAGCTPVRNSAMWGIGIRLTSSGWLYNVSGMYAIELSFKNSRKKVRIGTDRPDEIAKVVNEKTDAKMSGSSYEMGGHGGLYLVLALVAAAIIIPVIMIVYGSKETEVTFSDSAMIIGGMYGQNINYSDIVETDTLSALPVIKSRTNGFATGKILKGHFRLDDRSKVLLFIRKEVTPYIAIKTTETTVYLNFENQGKIREVFRTLKGRLAGSY